MGCLTVDCQRRGLCLPRRDILDLTALESADLFIDSALQTCNLALVLFRLRLLARADELLVLIVRSLFCIVKAPYICVHYPTIAAYSKRLNEARQLRVDVTTPSALTFAAATTLASCSCPLSSATL